jgi:Fic family protein
LFISEAINDNKKQYYEAISNTRNTNNDLTYFLSYILETANKYSLLYKNLEEIQKHVKITLRKKSDHPILSNYLHSVTTSNELQLS